MANAVTHNTLLYVLRWGNVDFVASGEVPAGFSQVALNSGATPVVEPDRHNGVTTGAFFELSAGQKTAADTDYGANFGVVANNIVEFTNVDGAVGDSGEAVTELLRLDGTRAMTGDLDVASNDIVGGFTVGGTLTAAQAALFVVLDNVNSVGFFGDPLSPALIVPQATTFDVAAGTGAFRTGAGFNSALGVGDWPAANGNVIPLDSVRFVGVEWNAGTPQVVVKTTNVWDLIGEWPLGQVTRDSDGVHETIAPIRLSSFSALNQFRIAETDPFARANGLRLQTTLLTVQRTAGRAWLLTTPIDYALFDTGATDTFDRYFGDAVEGFDVELNQTSWEDQSFYNGVVGPTLSLLSNNRFSVRWFYMDFQTGGLAMMYGTSNTNDVAVALLEEPPTDLPPRLQVGHFLLGRVVMQESNTVAIDVADIFGTDFSSGGGGDGDVTGPTGGTVADEVAVYADTSGKAIAGSGGLLSANLAVLDASRTFSKVVQSQATDDSTVVHTVANTGTNPGQSDELVGNRNPEGFVTAEPGTRYHRQDGVNSTEYILQSASTANTPWVEVGSTTGVTEIQTGLLSASAAVPIGGTPTTVAMDFSAVTFDSSVFTFTTLDTDITVLVSGRYRIFLEASVMSTSAGASTILGEIWDGGAPILEAQSQVDVEDATVVHNGLTVERLADLTGGAVIGPRFTQTAGAGSASVDPGGMRMSITFHAGSIPGAVVRKTDFGVAVTAPHAIDTNSGSPWKEDGSGQVTEIELTALLNTEAASGSFTVEFFFGPDAGPYTSLGSVSILQGTLSATLTLGAPVAYPAGTTFKVDRTAIGAFPGGTATEKTRITATFRVDRD